MCSFFCGRKFSTLLGKYQGVWLLSRVIRVCLVLWGITRLCFRVAILSVSPAAQSGSSWAPCVSSTWCYQHIGFSDFRCCSKCVMVQMIKNLPTRQEMRVHPWVRRVRWRREWLPTPVFLPEESHGQRSLAGCSPRGRREWDTPEWLSPYTQWVLEASPCCLNLHFLHDIWRRASRFSYLPPVCLLWWGVCSDLLPILNWVVGVPVVEFEGFFVHSGQQSFMSFADSSS